VWAGRGGGGNRAAAVEWAMVNCGQTLFQLSSTSDLEKIRWPHLTD
jgi:hypothetical protein